MGTPKNFTPTVGYVFVLKDPHCSTSERSRGEDLHVDLGTGKTGDSPLIVHYLARCRRVLAVGEV